MNRDFHVEASQPVKHGSKRFGSQPFVASWLALCRCDRKSCEGAVVAARYWLFASDPDTPILSAVSLSDISLVMLELASV